MITYAFAAKLFEGFSILRWNDRLRPIELPEIDHHALKSMLTYFLGKSAEHSNSISLIDWRRIVDVNVMDLLSKISTSDISSPVRKELKDEPAFKNIPLDDWGRASLKLASPVVNILKNYIEREKDNTSVESSILLFSHKYITSCEFDIIRRFSPNDDDITTIGNQIDEKVRHAIHDAFKEDAENLRNERRGHWLRIIMRIAERLRYQIRWSQTPRIPTTTVLGHSMYCAVLAYFLSVEANLSNERVVDNFYAALFHDFPEALSRDIIAPVKKADDAIAKLIEKVEKNLYEKEIFSHVPDYLQSHFRFITGHICRNTGSLSKDQIYDEDTFVEQNEEFSRRGEFSNRLQMSNNKYIIVPWGNDAKMEYEETMDIYRNEFGIDGKLLKMCDNIAAFMEARMSLRHGILSPHLERGLSNTLSACSGKRIYGLAFDDFFESITF